MTRIGQFDLHVRDMHLALFTRDALTAKHGSGAQLIRLLDGSGISYFHFYWWWGHGAISDRQPSFRLIAPDWMARKGLFRFFSALGMTWWKGTQINTKKLLALRSARGLKCDVAYCLIGDEATAARALSLVRAFGCPYIVHYMDLYEDELNPQTMPATAKLLEDAAVVLVITEPLEREVAKFAPRDLRRVFIGQDADVPQAKPPNPDLTLRVLLSGRVYESGLTLLEAALPQIRQCFHKIEFAYIGPEYEKIPPTLRPAVREIGFVPDEEYRQSLATFHLAFLMGPLDTDWLGKYSFPSRTSDYLMAGLPVLGCVGAGTATESVLMPLVPDAVRFTRTPQALVEALGAFTASPESWRKASAAARAFATKHMALETVRGQWTQALQDAVRSHGVSDLRTSAGPGST